MADNKTKKPSRELEIARQLANLLTVMPFEFMLNLQSTLTAKLGNDSNESLFEIGTEVMLDTTIKTEKRRLDVVVPLAVKPYREIIFELKLDEEDLQQVNGYAEARTESIVVSISRKPKLDKSKVEPSGNVIQLKWDDVFWCFFAFLDPAAQKRLIGKITNVDNRYSDSLYISPLEHALGEVAALYLEDFCRRIKPFVKINTERVIVVTGKIACSTTNSNNIYYCPANWDDDFNFLVVVLDSEIKYYGKVDRKLSPATYGNGDQNKPINLYEVVNASNMLDVLTTDQKNALNATVDFHVHKAQGIITWLVSVSNDLDPVLTVMNNCQLNKYKGKGAITQSHRYFDSPQDFLNTFEAVQ